MALTKLLSGLLQIVVTVAVLIAVGVVAFFITVFVVSQGARLAGYDPSGDFVVLSASLLVVAALLGGIPLGQSRTDNSPRDEYDTTGFQ
ncbi:hypothetical protein [Halovivax gelatinilyticus]|uniref:hypothetical protein n=1 Tax=Halovivax gelatinilyticus TaxID=2961597 RepID=UPI0020CA54FB|nr:hypothetical protein [Halovivax gelatinilyticus]